MSLTALLKLSKEAKERAANIRLTGIAELKSLLRCSADRVSRERIRAHLIAHVPGVDSTEDADAVLKAALVTEVDVIKRLDGAQWYVLANPG